MTLEQALSLLLVVVTFALALATSFVAIVTVRGFKEQLQLQTFAEYTHRYNELIQELPFAAARPAATVDIQQLEAPQREQVMKTMRRYFNLCWEELHLYKSGKIDTKTWEIWAAGMQDTLRSPFFQYAWAELKDEYTYGGYAEEFLEMIDRGVARHAAAGDHGVAVAGPPAPST